MSVYLRTAGRAGLSVLDRGEGAPGNRFHVRLVGRSDGGYNVGGGPTLTAAINDLIDRYQECIADVERGREMLVKAGQIGKRRQSR